jgi:hypothetical protein
MLEIDMGNSKEETYSKRQEHCSDNIYNSFKDIISITWLVFIFWWLYNQNNDFLFDILSTTAFLCCTILSLVPLIFKIKKHEAQNICIQKRTAWTILIEFTWKAVSSVFYATVVFLLLKHNQQVNPEKFTSFIKDYQDATWIAFWALIGVLALLSTMSIRSSKQI